MKEFELIKTNEMKLVEKKMKICREALAEAMEVFNLWLRPEKQVVLDIEIGEAPDTHPLETLLESIPGVSAVKCDESTKHAVLSMDKSAICVDCTPVFDLLTPKGWTHEWVDQDE